MLNTGLEGEKIIGAFKATCTSGVESIWALGVKKVKALRSLWGLQGTWGLGLAALEPLTFVLLWGSGIGLNTKATQEHEP